MTSSQGESFQTSSTKCFGQYKRSDKLCQELCALKLGCAIEKSRIGHIEFMEDLIASDGLIIKI